MLIGIKPATAPSTLQTGVIPAITRREVLEAHRLLETLGVRIERTYASIPVVFAVIDPEVGPMLRQVPIVNYIEPALELTLASLKASQDTSWGVLKVRAPQAWFDNRGHNGAITILDTGVDQQHLASGDGPVRLTDCLTAGFASCFDDHGHGSHVAGIAAARDDGQGFIGLKNYDGPLGLGVASVKVCAPNAFGRATCPIESVLGGLDWTTTNGRARQVVNMSFGGDQDPGIALQNAIAASYNAGNLLIASAGNDELNNNPPVSFPARYSQVIAVSGTLPDDTFADWITCPFELRTPAQGGSVFGSQVELSAPFWAKSMWLNGQYEVDCGTSMAAPVVSGTAALIWTKNPSWSNAQVRAHLQTSVKDLGAVGRDQFFGFGRVDAGAAVGIPFPSVTIAGPTSIGSDGNYQWTAVPSGGVGGYTYQWYRKVDYWWPRGAATCHYETDWEPVGTGSSYASFVTNGDYDFRLQVVVTSGTESAPAAIWVLVGDGSQECPMFAGRSRTAAGRSF